LLYNLEINIQTLNDQSPSAYPDARPFSGQPLLTSEEP
jgi:hypothetical protein